MMNGIKFNFTTNTITMTKAFAAAASCYGTEEYNVMKEIQKDFPNMKVVTRQNKRSSYKNPYKGLTYKFMRNFIFNLDKENLIVYEEIIAYYSRLEEDKTSVFLNVRDWFLENYSNYKDMIINGEPKARRTKKEAAIEAIASPKEEMEVAGDELAAAANF